MDNNEDNIQYVIEDEEKAELNQTIFSDCNSVDISSCLISLCMNVPTRNRDFNFNKVPKLVFIIPYRDRIESLNSFKLQMKIVLEDLPEDDYEIYFSHQCDTRDFNRGAIKNIGFLVIKNKYPDDYKNITFIFNDVDTTPSRKNLINYNTSVGTIKHFYGFTFSLGGIVSITGEDFEKINGYLNLWSWGYEDNSLQHRAINSNIIIDRSNYFKINSKEILQEQHGRYRIVNKEEFNVYKDFINVYKYEKNEGINSIFNIKYEITEDNFINIYDFNTGRVEKSQKNVLFDISDNNEPFAHKSINNRFRMIL